MRPRRQAQAWWRDRKPSGWEILVVLAVFPASSAMAAVDVLTERLTHARLLGRYVPVVLPGHPIPSALLAVPTVLLGAAPAVLAAYLLVLSGGGLACIGLDRRSVRADLARSGKLLWLAYLLPFLIAGLVLSPLRHTGEALPDPPAPAVFLIPLLASALVAGVVEEIVVLGYLVHRLEQRGWSGWRLVAVCTAVRVSYHLYYGADVLGFVAWGALSVVLYRRRRRLLPFIVVHALWDMQSFAGGYLPKWYGDLPFVALIVTVLVMFVAGRRAAVPPTSGPVEPVRVTTS